MPDLWLQPDPISFCLLALGGVALALFNALATARPAARVPALLAPACACGLAAGMVAAGLGAPGRSVSVALLLLAVLCLLLCASRATRLAAVCGFLLARARSPRWQSAVLLIFSPLLAVAWALQADRSSRGDDDKPGLGASADLGAALHAATGSHASTDRERPVPVFALRESELPRADLDPEENLIGGWRRTLGLLRTAPPDASSNCHGWVFTGGRYWLRGQEVAHILADNGYQEVTEPRAGDLAVFRSPDGHIVHSGVVRTGPELVLVESKWAWQGRYVHAPDNQPYAEAVAYYRSARSGHLLHGLHESPGELSQPAAERPATHYVEASLAAGVDEGGAEQ